MDLLQLHVQETLVWVSVVPFIRPMKLNIEKKNLTGIDVKKGGIHRALSNNNIDAGFSSSFTDGSFFPAVLRAFVAAFL